MAESVRPLEKLPHRANPAWSGLLPWLAYALGLRLGPVAGPALAFAACLLLLRRAGKPMNALDVGILGYFILLLGLALAPAGRQLSSQATFALCPAVLAVAAAASVLLHRPFTFAYAYPFAPAHLRDRPAFYRANHWISLLWMCAFATATVVILRLPGAWSLTHGGFVLAAILAAATAASVLLGGWFHFRHAGLTA